MTRPTEKEAEKARIIKLIKDIWENDCKRKRDELTKISIDDFIKVSVKNESADIHKSSFDNYFNTENKMKKQSAKDVIKNILNRL
jgi:hypothetical protein